MVLNNCRILIYRKEYTTTLHFICNPYGGIKLTRLSAGNSNYAVVFSLFHKSYFNRNLKTAINKTKLWSGTWARVCLCKSKKERKNELSNEDPCKPFYQPVYKWRHPEIAVASTYPVFVQWTNNDIMGNKSPIYLNQIFYKWK